MKRNGIAAKAALVLLAALVASSCALLEPRTGELTIPFPDELLRTGSPSASASRSIVSAGTELKYVRVYLEAQGGLIPLLKSAMVFETAIPADKTLTINDVPPIRNCTLYISMSVTPTDSTEGFRVVRYVKSQTFNIVAGGTETIELTPLYSPFQDLSVDWDAKGVRASEVGGATYVAANGRLKKVGDAAFNPVVEGSGYTRVNSLGAGKALNPDGTFGDPRLWINSDKGIWVLSADGATISKLDILDSKGAALDAGDVLESGTIELTYQVVDDKAPGGMRTEKAYAVFYQGLGKIGGAFGPGGTSAKWTWFALSEYMDKVPETIRPSLEGAKIVSDYWISGDGTYGYGVVPAIASLRIGGDIVQKAQDLGKSGTPSVQQIIDTFLADNMLSVPKVSNLAPLIKSLSKAGDSLFLGTDLGLFVAATAADGKVSGSPAFIDLQRAVSAVKVRSTTIDGAIYTAVLSKKGSLFVLRGDKLAATYLFYTGIPEFKNAAGAVDPAATGDIMWTSAGLVVTGSNGAALMSNAELAKLP